VKKLTESEILSHHGYLPDRLTWNFGLCKTFDELIRASDHYADYYATTDDMPDEATKELKLSIDLRVGRIMEKYCT
jgi:hypothetical protein